MLLCLCFNSRTESLQQSSYGRHNKKIYFLIFYKTSLMSSELEKRVVIKGKLKCDNSVSSAFVTGYFILCCEICSGQKLR